MSVASASDLAENLTAESLQQSGITSALTSPEQTTPTANSDSGNSSEEDDGSDDENYGHDDQQKLSARARKRQKIETGTLHTEAGVEKVIGSVPETEGALWERAQHVEHAGQTYHIGDHAILEDVENSSGTQGTELSPVGQILDIHRDAHSGATNLTVSWYVYPQTASHPPYMEFYKTAVLRTFRQTVVLLERVRELCFVVQPADAMVGHPSEWKEGKKIFVCDSRYVDKGDFIQKIKHWSRSIWPDFMDQKRREMLSTMVPWPNGPRELEKSLVPLETTDDSTGHTPQTRRVTRMTSAPSSDVATPKNTNAAALQQQLMQTPTPVSAQAQLLAYQQMLSQGRMNMPMALNNQMAPPPPPFILNQLQQQQQQLQAQLLQAQQQNHRLQQQQQSQQQQHQLQTQSVSNNPMLSPGSIASHTNAPSPLTSPTSFSVIQPPRRRGRPPKNKQLIEQRALEDAAAIAAIAQGRTPAKPAPAVKRRQSSSVASPYGNAGRPVYQQQKPNLTGVAGYSSINGSGGPHAMSGQPTYTPAQLLGTRNQGGIAVAQALQQQQLQQLQQQQQQLQQQQQRQQQANASKIAPLPHIDPTTVAQLPEEVVDLFPTADGKIKWFATAPVCHSLAKAAQHSQAYLDWLKQKKDKQLAAQRHSGDSGLEKTCASTASV